MPSPSSPRKWLALLLPLLLLVVAGACLYLVWRGSGQSTAKLQELYRLKDRALGLAENQQYAEADKLLQELAKELPNEPLVLRNLAVVRVGMLESLRDAPGQNAAQENTVAVPPEQLIDAIQRLLAAEPDEPASHILASRAARQLQRLHYDTSAILPEPLAALRKAAELAPSDAAVRFELYQLSITPAYRKNEEAMQAGRNALAQAHELQPRNLALLLWLLGVQAEAQDPKIRETIGTAKEVLAPLKKLMPNSFDLTAKLAEISQAADDGDWRAIRGLSIQLNIAKSTWPQRTDIMRVEVGALEYLRHDFSDALVKRYASSAALQSPESDNRFVRQEASFPPLAEIHDLRLADVDLNGRLDLVVLHGQQLTVLSRPRDGEAWTMLLEVEVPPGMQRLLAADLDRDAAKLPPGLTPRIDRLKGVKKPGDDAVTDEFMEMDACKQAFPDFVLFGTGGVCFVRNEKGGAVEEASSTGGLARKLTLPMVDDKLASIGNVTAAILVDFDHDQDLDLVVGVEGKGIRLWRMLGSGTFKFEDYTQWSSLPAMDGTITSLALVDWDRDLYTDIFVAFQPSDAGQNPLRPILLLNERHGQMRGEHLGDDYAPLAGCVDLAPIELDGNVSWDLVGLRENGVHAVLTTTPVPGKVNFLKGLPAVEATGSRLLAWDYDNDGYPDALVWNDKSIAIFRGTTAGFEPLDASRLAFDAKAGLRAVDYGDVDGDGDLDLVLATPDGLVLLDNQGTGVHRWLQFYVTGDFDGSQKVGANNSAIGTIAEVRTSQRYQAQVITRQPVHFGLGTAEEAELVRLLFTNGIPRTAANAKANTTFCELQILGGSCPFIYTWDGAGFAFFSDCLWAAPIGLQVAEGKMAPSRAWEYLLIPGERLKERNGTYDLQLTEELWEAAYFDELKLIAVDHPADTDLYTNEKVGGPDLAAPKLHLVSQPRRPIAARDKHGRDVLATVSQRDDVYFRGFDGHITQGLVDEHFLELNLGQLEPAPKRVTLFLTGWIYPTNTSINVNLSQHPDLEYPRLPYVQVSDGSGGWKEAQAFMGFPGGKTKTIAVELAGNVFAPADYKLRICTSAEIYWDDVFFTVDEEPIEGQSPLVQEHTLPLVWADLHFRGFSRELPRHPRAPLRFDYSVLSTDPKWPPMGGMFTRYGDVLPLLRKADDQMVVMGSGDEMTVRFRAPAEKPPPGWKRDFILYSVGWDKDADLNTVYGQTAEPLPFNAMPSYPYPPDSGYPNTPEHARYLQTYQTRQQPHWRFWRKLAK